MKSVFRIIIGTVIIIGIALVAACPKFDGGPHITTNAALGAWASASPDDLTNGPRKDALIKFLYERRSGRFPVSEMTNYVHPNRGVPSVKDGYGKDILVTIDRLEPDPNGLTVGMSFTSFGRGTNSSKDIYRAKGGFYLESR
jgi:hypothetical protein